MRTYEKVQETKVWDVLAETKCDLCGAIAKDGNWDSSYWSINTVDVEIKIQQREGSEYPDGGSGTEIKVDLCPKCFKEKLVPFLRSNGADIKEVKWDF